MYMQFTEYLLLIPNCTSALRTCQQPPLFVALLNAICHLVNSSVIRYQGCCHLLCHCMVGLFVNKLRCPCTEMCKAFHAFIVEDGLFFVALALKCVRLFTPDTLEGTTSSPDTLEGTSCRTSSQNLVNRSLSSYFTILVFFLQGHTLLSCYDISFSWPLAAQFSTLWPLFLQALKMRRSRTLSQKISNACICSLQNTYF